MKTIVIADIHANLPALEAVIKDIDTNYNNIVFLGDIANFGPHPIECIDMIQQLGVECIQGNHDFLISNPSAKRNFWDEWTREQLPQKYLDWLAAMPEKRLLFNSILAVHGSYDVEYDILPYIPSVKVEEAFARQINEGINAVWFGHYHYDLSFNINGISYVCIRPVGHHRDKDNRASYYVYEDGRLIHKKVEYDVEKTIYDTNKISCLTDEFKCEWASLLRTGYSETILHKDIKQIENYKKLI